MQLARTAEKQLRADAKGKKTTKHTCAKYGKIRTKKNTHKKTAPSAGKHEKIPTPRTGKRKKPTLSVKKNKKPLSPYHN